MPKRLTSADLIERLRGAGYTQKEIAAVVGRSDRMVRKVGAGQSDPPGFRDALRKAWDTVRNRARRGHRRASVEDLKKVAPAPPRRATAAGREARLRKGVWTMPSEGAVTWATGVIGSQAARAGGRQLLPGVEMAAARMWQMSVTITFRERQRGPGNVRKGAKWYPPKHHGPPKPTKKIKVWHAGCRLVPRDVLEQYAGRGDEHLVLALLGMLVDEEIIDYDDEHAALLDIERAEIRVWEA